jgi:DNA-binding LacI/PurR family transcriptional regulator/signal transduction histidine kinase/ActR/RegA family two-component response regulator
MASDSKFPKAVCSSGRLPLARCVSTNGRPGRKTIAVLIDFIDQTTDGYESDLRRGFEKRCRARDVNLLMVVGRALDDVNNPHHNDVYRKLTADCVDGLVLVSAGLSFYLGPDEFLRWCRGFSQKALCSVGMSVPGIPSIVVDNVAGMREVVEHVIVKHGRRRIAYLDCEGNADAYARLQVFRSVLAEHGLSQDMSLLIQGSFEMTIAERSMFALLDRDASFDAVVAANDGMAIGAMRALQSRGFRVPEDVLITGFDDVATTSLTVPTITTVRQPLAQMAEMAIDTILRQLDGLPVAEKTALPAQLLVRESCGCGDDAGLIMGLLRNPAAPRSTRTKCDSAQDLAERALAALPESARNAGYAHAMAEALFRELDGKRDALFAVVTKLLSEHDPHRNPCDTLLPLLVTLRLQLPVAVATELESVWYSAERSISSAHTRLQAELRLRTETMYEVLLRTATFMLVTSEVASLQQSLQQALPPVHNKDLLLGLINEQAEDRIELFIELRDGINVKPQSGTLSTAQFLSHDWGDSTPRRTLFVLPLTNETRMFGILVVEEQAGFFNYQLLRDHISGAFKAIALQEETVRQKILHERSVQERIATAERMRSLSVLAGGVAHDLNNALGSLVALSDVVLEELDEIKNSPAHSDADMRTDLVAIKQGAMRAAETIKDLMTLGRRNQVTRATLDLNDSVDSCVRDIRLRSRTDQANSVHLRWTKPETPMLIAGSESHIIRALNNLIRNALEAAGNDGVVSITMETLNLSDPLLLYEVVPPGEYVAVSIIDTGPGISEEQLSRVFEPFFTTKKLSEVSGSGLGLAIVHSVVKEHEGFLDVSSTVGHGTRFTLYFPLAHTVVKVSPKPVLVRHGRARILAVDDDPIQLRVAQRVLSRLGYEVTTLASGVQAFHLLCGPQHVSNDARSSQPPASSEFDVIIMDMALNEDQTGLEVFERIRHMCPRQKGIIASGHGAAYTERNVGHDGLLWLSKPYTASALAEAVQTLLESDN